jgi:hypothetical protein
VEIEIPLEVPNSSNVFLHLVENGFHWASQIGFIELLGFFELLGFIMFFELTGFIRSIALLGNMIFYR